MKKVKPNSWNLCRLGKKEEQGGQKHKNFNIRVPKNAA
jgi:hypothetical protein